MLLQLVTLLLCTLGKRRKFKSVMNLYNFMLSSFLFLSPPLSLSLSFLGLASSQEAYYGYHGYSFFSSGSQVLSRGNESLSISFRSCQSDGLLLYATESLPGTGYFSIGLYQSRILIEFNFGNDLREVRMQEVY